MGEKEHVKCFLNFLIPQLIHSPTESPLGYFHVWMVMNQYALNIHVQLFLWT